MKFARIEMLFLIWAVPVVFLVYYYGSKKRKRIMKRYSFSDSRSIITPSISPARRRVKAGLVLGVFLCMAVALAGPQYGFRWQEIERKGVDIFIAIDCSRSMLASDIRPSRLERAKFEVFDLLSMLEGDRVGLIAFAGNAFVQCPLTLDYEAFNIFMDVLSPDYLPVGGTNISGAIESALAGFSDKDASEKAIIIITDGESTGGDPVAAAEKAKEMGVKIFCIGVGKQDGIPVSDKDGGFKKDSNGKIILTKIDEESLKTIASLTGGNYVRSVAGDMDLETIYTNNIRSDMERTTLTSGKKKVWEDRYQWFLGISILFMIVVFLIPSSKSEVEKAS